MTIHPTGTQTYVEINLQGLHIDGAVGRKRHPIHTEQGLRRSVNSNERQMKALTRG